MAARRKQAVRGNGGGPGWLWFGIGVLLGAVLASIVFIGGYGPTLRSRSAPVPNPDAEVRTPSEPGIADTPPARDYDFYSVLPEMEVVIPDAELSATARREVRRATEAEAGSNLPPAETGGRYVLQAGSFQDAADAESVKARLALMGFMASVQTVNINGQTWNRVRLGPWSSAAQLEETKQRLEAAGVHAIALKEQ